MGRNHEGTLMDARERRYLDDQAITASPAQLTAMLFDGAVAAIRLGTVLAEGGDWIAAGQRWIKAERIVTQLRITLDASPGGDVADLASHLEQLYIWVNTCLSRAISGRDVKMAANALATLAPLADAWRTSCVGQRAAA
jgi:flagellar protein FliS